MQRQGLWTVFFRPDADGSRQEVVVEYGTFYDFSASPPKLSDGGTLAGGDIPVHIFAPYTAIISSSGTTLATLVVPNHWWRARWRWQSAPRPLKRTFADLVAMKAVLPMDLAFVKNTPPATGLAWAGPMDTGGLTSQMTTTGDRNEIGFITEPQACWFLNGDANSLQRLMTNAEAMGSVPAMIRDLATNAPFDVYTYQLCHQVLTNRWLGNSDQSK